MNASNLKRANVDEYIALQSAQVTESLQRIRQIIFSLCSEVQESISYGMPAYKLNGKPLVYFAGYDHHIGFYATPTGHKAFEKELSVYKQGKWSVQFPLDKPLPYDLIEKIVKFRVEESEKKYKR